MPWIDFFWYDENLSHLADHKISPEEFEEVVMASRFVEFSDSGSDMVRGQTASGRWLVCIFQRIDEISILPITAYEPSKGNE